VAYWAIPERHARIEPEFERAGRCGRPGVVPEGKSTELRDGEEIDLVSCFDLRSREGFSGRSAQLYPLMLNPRTLVADSKSVDHEHSGGGITAQDGLYCSIGRHHVDCERSNVRVSACARAGPTVIRVKAQSMVAISAAARCLALQQSIRAHALAARGRAHPLIVLFMARDALLGLTTGCRL
jgi:hypothetical protein